MTPPPLRLGLLGAGAAIRKLHLPALAALRGDIAVEAVYSHTPGNARRFAAEHGIPRHYADYRALLADARIDAVLIAVPIEHNAALLIEAVVAGKHVLAEKPIAATAAQARQAVDVCRRADRVVAIAENYRYREDILHARDLVRAGAIGRVQCFQATTAFDLTKDFRRDYMEKDWRRMPAHPGGLVVDAGVHAAAGIREILGEVRSVDAQLMNNGDGTAGPDGLVMQLSLADGAPGHCLACYTARTDHETVFDLVVYGDRGTLWLTEGQVQWTTGGDAPRATWQAAIRDRGYLAQLQDFVWAVRGGGAVYSTPEKALGDLLLIDAALQSASSGRRLAIAELA
jgi:predicted dehydrogenase